MVDDTKKIPKTLRVAARQSQLARIQSDLVEAQLRQTYPTMDIEIIEIAASGDWNPSQGETRLSARAGGKGMFVKDIQKAILEGEVDIGVHCLKDVPYYVPEGLQIKHVLEREDPRDVFLSNDYKTLYDLPEGATVGTASVRRQAFLLKMRPDLNIVPFRGNVNTRIEKLRDGQVDATILAAAGLIRLNRQSEINSYFEVDEMLPACGQGILCIEMHKNRPDLEALFEPINCQQTYICAQAERAVIETIEGDCSTPIAAYAVIDEEGMLYLRTQAASLDGKEIYFEEGRTSAELEAGIVLGKELGQALLRDVPAHIIKGANAA